MAADEPAPDERAGGDEPVDPELDALRRDEHAEVFFGRHRLPWIFHRSGALSPAERRDVLEQLFFEGPEWVPFLWRNYILMGLSAAIAALGLKNDSAAVVIGAMLVAPLMTPLMAFAAAMVMAWPKRQLKSAIVVVTSSALAVAIAFGLERALGGNQAVLGDELVARTEPNLFDLGIAIFAGAAGAYVTVRRKAGGALPGVAIAVALVPPLAAIGVLLARNRLDAAEGASLLFLINLAAIVFSAAAVLLVTGFLPRARTLRHRATIRWGLGIALAAVVVVAVPLVLESRRLVSEDRTRESLTAGIERWLGERDLTIDDIQLDEGGPEGWKVRLRLVGTDPPPPASTLAEPIADSVGRAGRVRVEWVQLALDEVRAEPDS